MFAIFLTSATVIHSEHIAIIPDGNRRWAKNQNTTANKGHEAGFEALRSILRDGKDLGIKVLSFYAFSTENFNKHTDTLARIHNPAVAMGDRGVSARVWHALSQVAQENDDS